MRIRTFCSLTIFFACFFLFVGAKNVSGFDYFSPKNFSVNGRLYFSNEIALADLGVNDILIFFETKEIFFPGNIEYRVRCREAEILGFQRSFFKRKENLNDPEWKRKRITYVCRVKMFIKNPGEYKLWITDQETGGPPERKNCVTLKTFE